MSVQINAFSKTGLLDRIQVEHHRLEILLDQLDENQMVQPGVAGSWSVKDILAHITAWEQQLLQCLHETLQGLTPDLPANKYALHRWNVRIYEENQFKPLGDVIEMFHQSFQDVLQTIAAASEEELLGEIHGAWPEGPLWQGIADNTWGHYKEHAASIRGWMKKNK
jgi:hypothetical protein